MNRNRGGVGCKSEQRFRLGFQRRLRESLARQHSVAEGFGPAWEATLDEVPVNEDAQGALYRELLAWARSDELFTGARQEALLQAWRQTVHEF
jgi:hypothetical protein